MKTKLFHLYVDEMYPMKKGELIADPDRGFRVGDGLLTRKRIKHIVEQRKAEGKSADEIKEIIDHIPDVIAAPDLELPNRNQKYPDGIMRFKAFQEWERAVVVVMDRKKGVTRKIIIAHLYSSKRCVYYRKSSTHPPLGRRLAHKPESLRTNLPSSVILTDNDRSERRFSGLQQQMRGAF